MEKLIIVGVVLCIWIICFHWYKSYNEKEDYKTTVLKYCFWDQYQNKFEQFQKENYSIQKKIFENCLEKYSEYKLQQY